jgi:hypothetical protein
MEVYDEKLLASARCVLSRSLSRSPALPLWLALSLALALPAQAAIIHGGSSLLDQSSLGTLENWLGHGKLTLTNIFTSQPGDVGVDFHAAADGKGPTFSVMRALSSDGSGWKTVGGYNPLSWDSSGQVHFTPDPPDWTAFIFNLTDSVLKRQTGPGQTTNRPFDGPTFGILPLGPDLGVTADLSQLYSSGWSYGDGMGSDYRRSIVDGTLNAPNTQLALLEVFSISVSAVPEPPPALLLLAGTGALLLLHRLKRLRPTLASSAGRGLAGGFTAGFTACSSSPAGTGGRR